MSEILPTINDIQQRRISTENLQKFRGKLGSFAFITDDNMRMVVFDGATLGGASKVALLESADFTVTPTAPNRTIDSDNPVPDNAILNFHDIKQILGDLGEDVLSKKLDHTIIKDSIDLNKEKTDGLYFTNNGTNTPFNSFGYLLVNVGTNSVSQTWITTKEDSAGAQIPQVYIRVLDSSNNLTWYKYLTSYDIDVDDIARLSTNNVFLKNIEIKGDLTGPTIEGKLDHTKLSTETDLNNLTEDGLYYIKSTYSVANAPSGITEFFLHVHTVDSLVLQELIMLKGKVLYRHNKSGTFTEWASQSVELPHADSMNYGVVKISNTPVDGDNNTALSLDGAFELVSAIQSVENQAESNQELITVLTQKVNDSVTNLTVKSTTNPLELIILDKDNGTIELPISSETAYGLTRPATLDEIKSKSNNYSYISPVTIGDAVSPILVEELDKVFSDTSGSGTSAALVETVTNTIITSTEFSEKVTELISTKSLSVSVVSDSEFSEETAKENVLYLITE